MVKCRIARNDPECIDKIQMDTDDIKSYSSMTGIVAVIFIYPDFLKRALQ